MHNISQEELDRYLSFHLTKEENSKAYYATRIEICPEKNNGDVKIDEINYTGKCFFISLAMYLQKKFPSKSISQLVSEMMLISGINGLHEKVELINFEGEKTVWTHHAQIEALCEVYLEDTRVEIYLGVKDGSKTFIDLHPEIVFNKDIISPENTARIVHTLNPEHFEFITESEFDFFHPVLLNMSTEEVNDFLNKNLFLDEQKDRELMKKREKEDCELARIIQLEMENEDYLMVQKENKDYELARNIQLEIEKQNEQNTNNDKLFMEFCIREGIC